MNKRIISCFASIALLSSMCAINAYAEIKMANVDVSYTEVTKAEFESEDYMNEALPEGYGAYMVKADLSGIGDLNCKISAKKYNGRRLSNFSIALDFGDSSNIYEDYCTTWDSTLTTTGGVASGTTVYNAIFNAGGAADAYPNTNNATVSDAVEDAINVLLVAKPGTELKVTAMGRVDTYAASKSTAGAEEVFRDSDGNVTCTKTLVLGGSSTVAVTGVSIKDKADFTLDLNGETTKTLEAVVAPADATNKAVTWSSDNEKAATVVDGKVTAVGEGEAKITVTTVDGGFTDSVKVTVKDTTPPEKPIVDVTPSKITGDYGTKTLKYIAKIVKNADATAFIKVTKTLNGKTESKETTQTIAELLGGVATEGTLVSADVAIGVLTADTDAVFSFGLVK